jgi:hypothetical protein
MGTLKRKQIEKKLKKICGNLYLTDELLEDDVALGAVVRATLLEEGKVKIKISE